jgi:phospholipase C
VPLINPQGVEYTQIYPCFEHQTLADLLEAAGVSWRYYGVGGDSWPNPGATGIWMAPNAIQHICGAEYQRCTGTEWTSHIALTPAAILSDATNCNLRGVSWVVPSGVNSDHSLHVNTTGGPSWVASIVNAVGNSTCKNRDGSSYWSSTAIIVTWDDWGGWYDHEPPPTRAYPYGGHEMGFRVPLIVVSAYTPAGFSGVQPYLDLVKAYGWGNYMFQTNQGPSFAAHQYLFGATAAPSADDDHNGIFAAENGGAGCAAPKASTVPLINPQGVFFKEIYPCFEHQTLADLLETAGVSWRYYGVGGDIWMDPRAIGIWMAPNAIQHICGAVGQRCTGTEWTSHTELTPSAVLSDISTNCHLRGVSWVIPSAFNSDHSWDVRSTGGPSWVASIVNAVGNSKCKNRDGSSYWSSTAIIVTWDDWGGWYDHEPPTTRLYPYGGYELGFRVPLIVVSAYTPAGFISNSQEDFGSVIRFIEWNFGIMEGALTFADSRSADDLRSFFSLGNPPSPFQSIKAPLSANYFLTAKPSNIPPDDD